MKRGALLAVKVAVSLALLVYLFATSDLQALEERVRTADLLLLSAAVGCYVAMLALATWRWQLLLEALGVVAPLRHLTASYLVATFFNNFLPSNIGGDIVRVRDGSRFTGSTTSSLAVVGIDRILGLGALWVIGAIAFVFAGPEVRELAGARAVILGLGLVFLALATIFFRPGIARRLMARLALNGIDWIRERFEEAQAAVHSYRAQVRNGMAGLSRQPGAAGTGRLVLPRHRPGPPNPPRRVRRFPHGASVHPAPGGADLVQRLGAAGGPLHPVLLPDRASP